MSDGRLTRLAILCSLLLLPLASAAPPSAREATGYSVDGQDITDLAADASAQFVSAVVAFDTAKATTGIGLPGGAANPHDDVYLCNYGAPTSTTGVSCLQARHDSQVVNPLVQPANAPQRVAAAPGGVFAVAGPDRFVSLWRATAQVPEWTRASADDYAVVNVTLLQDGSRVIIGTAPPSPTGEGRIEARKGKDGASEWVYGLKSPEGASVRPTSLDVSRGSSGIGVFVLAIGTTDGVLFADPTGSKPSSVGALPQADTVSKVQLSADGKYVVAGASNGVFLARLERSHSNIVPAPASVFNNNFGETAQDVAISLDGTRFAAAVGSKIHFYKRLDTAELATPLGSHDAGARVADIAYDERGQILVAIAGNKVMGFGPTKTTPMWTFDATSSEFGGLDGPLRKVAVSDDGMRIIVAGKTKMNGYNSAISVQASLASATGATAMQPTQTMQLTITAKNTGSLADNYSFSIVPPVGWTHTSAEDLKLAPDEVGTARFNVTAPAGASPGSYGVSVRVRSQATDDLASRRNIPTAYAAGPAFNITIPRSVVLRVEAPDDRIQLRQGGEQTIGVVLRNEGNADGIVNLSVRQEPERGASWDIRYLPGDQVTVPASGSTNIQVILRAPAEAGSGDRNVITLRAREGETVEATDQLIAYVDAQFGAELRTNRTAWEFFPGQVQTIRLNVTNTGNTEDVYNLTHSVSPSAIQSDWRVTIESPQVTVKRGETKVVAVTVKAVASDAREATLNLVAKSQNSPDRKESELVLNLMPIPRPPTDEDEKLIPGPIAGAALLAVAVALVLRRGGAR